MQQYVDALTEWTHENDMVVNSGKTKGMIMGHTDISNLPPLCTKQVKLNESAPSNCSGYMWTNLFPGTVILII